LPIYQLHAGQIGDPGHDLHPGGHTLAPAA
jgi:hypothetical protein